MKDKHVNRTKLCPGQIEGPRQAGTAETWLIRRRYRRQRRLGRINLVRAAEWCLTPRPLSVRATICSKIECDLNQTTFPPWVSVMDLTSTQPSRLGQIGQTPRQTPLKWPGTTRQTQMVSGHLSVMSGGVIHPEPSVFWRKTPLSSPPGILDSDTGMVFGLDPSRGRCIQAWSEQSSNINRLSQLELDASFYDLVLHRLKHKSNTHSHMSTLSYMQMPRFKSITRQLVTCKSSWTQT